MPVTDLPYRAGERRTGKSVRETTVIKARETGRMDGAHACMDATRTESSGCNRLRPKLSRGSCLHGHDSQRRQRDPRANYTRQLCSCEVTGSLVKYV